MGMKLKSKARAPTQATGVYVPESVSEVVTLTEITKKSVKIDILEKSLEKSLLPLLKA